MVQHCMKYLGVVIDDDLSFKSQVEKKLEKTFVLQLHSSTKALPEKISIACILQNTRQTNCTVWRFGVWMHSY